LREIFDRIGSNLASWPCAPDRFNDVLIDKNIGHFELLNPTISQQYAVWIGAIENYGDRLVDLLDPRSQPIEIKRMDARSNITYPLGLRRVPVRSMQVQ
jgi:hypothetical protein